MTDPTVMTDPMNLNPKKIVLEEEFAGRPPIANLPTETVPSLPPRLWKDHDGDSLLVTRHRGSFMRPCPATPVHVCCGLNIFHFGQGCRIRCSYCVLSHYLASGAMVLFGNVDEGLGVLSERLDLLNSDPSAFQNLPRDAVRDPGHPGDRPVRPPSPRSHRFCTGEFADSLLLDPLTGLSEKLVGIFARQKLGILELKTKTANVDHLLNLDHRGKTVISFSMNSPKIAKTEEPLAPPPLERAKAAAGAAERGYGVGFHFDPLIWSPDYPEGLRETVSMIFDRVDPGAVAWISMGCFRYLPEMKPLLSKNGAGRLFAPEFAKADDGKFRYPRPLRREMYQCLLDLLRPRVSPATILHLCMESPRLWEDLFGFNPGTGGLTAAFRDFRPPKAP